MRAMEENTVTYYTQTENRGDLRQKLIGSVETDVCIIGGGLAGVNTLLELSEKKVSAILLEGETIGNGASGRNGGFLSAGYSVPITKLEQRLGKKYAQELYKLSVEGVDIVHQRSQKFSMANIEAKPGIIRISWGPRNDSLTEQIDYLNRTYNTNLNYWSRNKVREHYSSKKYNDAVFNPDGYQLHSLNYIHKCAEASEDLGAKIFEQTPAYKVSKRNGSFVIDSNQGQVKANTVVICISASNNHVNRKLYNSILPVGTFVLLTEPLYDQLSEAIRAPYAVSDNRRIENYYRPLQTTQILWGGGISMRLRPSNLKQKMLRDLLKVYPQLTGIKAELAWSGTMGYALHSMPQIGKLDENMWYLQGFGGHGLNTTALGGKLITRAIVDDDDTFELFSPFKLNFIARPFGSLGAQFIYWNWKMRDIWDEFKR